MTTSSIASPRTSNNGSETHGSETHGSETHGSETHGSETLADRHARLRQTPAPRPRPVWLAKVRPWIVGVGVVALALGLYLLSIPFQPAYLRDQIDPAGLEQLRQAVVSLGFYAGYFTVLNAIFVLVFWIVAAVIFWRKSDDRMGIFASLTLVLFGITAGSSGFTGMATYYPAMRFLWMFVPFLGGACFTLFFYLFPDGRFAPRWIRWLVPLVVVRDALYAFRPYLLGNDWFFPVELASIWFFPVELASVIFAQIYRYWRVSNSVQRQQTKWVVFGTTLGLSGGGSLMLLHFVVGGGQGKTP